MSRNIKDLHPILQKKVEELKTACEKKGLKIGIGECFRTVAEQDALYAKGRTTSGSIVTNAKGSTYSSMHQWGVAFDFYRNDGKGAYNDSDGFFSKVGKIGKSIGLEWGGSWTSPVDKPHFQLPDWGSTPSKLKAQYGTVEKFKKTWNTTTTKSTTTKKTSYFSKYSGTSTSLVIGLEKVGAKSSFTYRTKIAKANGIANYQGTAAQNTKLLNLLKTGKLLKP